MKYYCRRVRARKKSVSVFLFYFLVELACKYIIIFVVAWTLSKQNRGHNPKLDIVLYTRNQKRARVQHPCNPIKIVHPNSQKTTPENSLKRVLSFDCF